MEVPEVDTARCTLCGQCAAFCQFKALSVMGKKLLIFPEMCHGCGGCLLLCPEKALSPGGRELGQIVSGHFQEVQKYLSMTGHVYTPTYVVAGASWKRLPPDVQKVLSDTAKEMQPVALKMAADLDKKLLAQIEKNPNIKVNEADKDAFIKASKPIYDEFAKEVPGGQELIDKALALGHKGS